MTYHALSLLFAISGARRFVAAVPGAEMTKMCLFYEHPAGHARSDPIISNACASSHVHSFYGVRMFHPDTRYEDLLRAPADQNTSPIVENKSLYWHPSFYRVSGGMYRRVDNLESSPYYRWDKSVTQLYAQDANKPYPAVEAFPPGFRMIAASNDPGADGCGLNGACGEDSLHAMFSEACNYSSDREEQCIEWEGELALPAEAYAFVGIALNMPTCWNGQLDSPNHKSHMAYTLNGAVAGPCPPSHPRRVPQVQLFVRLNDYQGGTYELSDGQSAYHVDFFNGWEEGRLQEVIDGCAPQEQDMGEFNPPCDCTPETPDNTQQWESTLTINRSVLPPVCDADVRRLIVDEAIDVTTDLPRYGASCEGASVIPRSWTDLIGDLFSNDCAAPPPPPAPTPASSDVPDDEDELPPPAPTPASSDDPDDEDGSGEDQESSTLPSEDENEPSTPSEDGDSPAPPPNNGKSPKQTKAKQGKRSKTTPNVFS